MEIILQEVAGKLFRSCFSGFRARRRDLLLFDFISKEALFTFPFSRMGQGFATCADGGTIYFYFFSVQVVNSLAGKL